MPATKQPGFTNSFACFAVVSSTASLTLRSITSLATCLAVLSVVSLDATFIVCPATSPVTEPTTFSAPFSASYFATRLLDLIPTFAAASAMAFPSAKSTSTCILYALSCLYECF